jgi:hypothetical protein
MHRPVRALIPILFAVSLVSLVAVLTVRRAEPVPLYAARTGLMCASCHFDPNGGGPRNEFGFNFAKQRHDLTPEDSTSQWGRLALVNRVGDSFPLYFGVNQRFMALANTTVKSDSLDRAGFYSMETALYVTFQPHPRLTLVYSRDGFESGSMTQDAFGMISGFGWNGYLKAGRFRTPFGLRLDDHTVATRNSFLDFQSPPLEPGFLPYDPRFPDEGLEYGVTKGDWFGRASLTNGRSNALGGSGGPFAAAWTGKLGYNRSAFQVAGSFYDDYYKSGLSLYGYKRTTRWGAYGLTHWKKLAFLGELDAGTDEVPSGVKVNKWAGFVETDYAPVRWTNFRLRYDALSLANLGDPVIRDQGQYQRWSLEGEFVPVPFAEIRWALRYIDPKLGTDPNTGESIPNERQAFVQFHFSY